MKILIHSSINSQKVIFSQWNKDLGFSILGLLLGEKRGSMQFLTHFLSFLLFLPAHASLPLVQTSECVHFSNNSLQHEAAFMLFNKCLWESVDAY